MKKIDWFLDDENYNANLYPYAIHFDADYRGFREILGRGLDHQAIGISKGFLRQTHGYEDYVNFAKFVYHLLNKDKSFAKRNLRELDRIVRNFYLFQTKMLYTDLSLLTNNQLAAYFKEFYTHFFYMSTWGVPFVFSEHFVFLWTNELTSYLKTKLPADRVEEANQLLCSSYKHTFTGTQKEQVLKLAIEIKKEKITNIFNQLPKEIIEDLTNMNPDLLFRIKKQRLEFEWLHFGFEGPVIDLDGYLLQIKQALDDPESELKRLSRFKKMLPIKQKQVTKHLKIDKAHQHMINIMREFGHMKAYRKDIEYRGYYVYDTCLLKEFARRFGYSVEQSHYLMIKEIVKILKTNKKIKNKELDKRIENCFYVNIKGKSRLLVGKKAEKFIKGIRTEEVDQNIIELKGTCACIGKVSGTVKVIKHKTDYSKFTKGDILITYATNPNMVPLMKKASAIVTDEGGITCHAAIVSRELGVPCIVGTRFSTKIFKDNDQVEVNATLGTIKKV